MTTELGPAEVERLFVLHERSNAFETLIEWTYRRLLHEGDIAIDGGAHGGLHTVPMSKLVGPHGQVLAGFGPAGFAEPWNSRLVPHYSVAAPSAMREAVAAACLASARELLDSKQD